MPTYSPPEERSHRELSRLLDQAVEQPERRDEVTAEITRIFGQKRAILVADLDSFTAATAEHGIVSFLILLHEVQRLARPIIAKHRGLLLKSEADTLFCLFDTAADALEAAVEIRGSLQVGPLRVPGRDHVTIAVGVGFGAILNVGDVDALGNEVNFAYKLGEEVGLGGEILLTRAARAEITAPGFGFEERHTVVSRVPLPYFAFTG
jgi:adenylate cyclase